MFQIVRFDRERIFNELVVVVVGGGAAIAPTFNSYSVE